MKHFLERVSKSFEIVLYTAARKEYADVIVDRIDPLKRYFHARLYRQHCEHANEYFVKNLKVVMNRTLRDSILVDNLLYSFAATPYNGVLIKPFLLPGPDDELKHLASVLEHWRPGVEARSFVESQFGQKDFFRHLSRSS